MKTGTFLFTLVCFFALAAGAQNAFYKATDKITLSYDEFRALTPEKQELWIKELRAFNHNIELIESGQRISEKRSKLFSIFPWLEEMTFSPKVCATWELLKPAASYAADERCQVEKRVQGGSQYLCVKCPGDAHSGVNVCTSPWGSSDEVSRNLLKEFEKKDYSGARVNIDAATLARHVEIAQDEGSAAFSAPVERKNTVVKTVVTPASSQPVVIELGPDAKVERPSTADPITTVESRDASGAVLERVSNDRRVEDFRLRNLSDVGNLKGNDNLDVDEVTSKGRLACIYAGWALQGSGRDGKGRCLPVSEREVMDASGKRVTYSCKHPPSDGSISGNDGGDAVVLCNPVIFGIKNNKPLCIKRSKTATEDCTKLAGSAKDTLDFARNNPQEYRALVRRVDTLCQQDETALREHFNKRGYGQRQISNAVKDLGSTCSHLRERMAELVDANKATAPRAGVR
ncbi:hypothetical protein QJS83_12885 [Bdellovibrio sp. 22V]|uniref:hypothetical protein n=1 Tax=Bdellovibrio sp. 22V TaxID=3044166 RepID=UPI0025431099|nr:hypothetical protein [Bdellovibrio sp. 22V]WII71358.1 hypothetical protein QJS83_12885 [Bdellovibrio sp. 22V]